MYKRILERHDDVGTMGIVLYTDGERLYKDVDLKEGLMTEELAKIAFHDIRIVFPASPESVFRVAVVHGYGVDAFNGGHTTDTLSCIDVEIPA